jgi:hypothetical protein
MNIEAINKEVVYNLRLEIEDYLRRENIEDGYVYNKIWIEMGRLVNNITYHQLYRQLDNKIITDVCIDFKIGQ